MPTYRQDRNNAAPRRIAVSASLLRRIACIVAFGLGMAGMAYAQDISINLGQGTGVTERALQMVALLTVLSLAPSILIMVTSFARIVIVLSLLRTAIGTQSSPPNTVLTGLALFMTAFIMAPTFQAAYDAGVRPLLAGEVREIEAFERASQPFKAFMLKHVRPTDLDLFIELSRQPRPTTPEATSLTTLVPAFMISELRRAFEIGFLLFLPFLIIDLVVSSILISMGMMMVPPITVSLPFKLIFFVLVDGWRLVTGSLVQSFGTL
ncbi:MAG: flagellar type III secretion system pore protein FliP [Proteobacteria bacterium]|nr:flagellar type III secretion system pore protein FliP [Pseudomonadota bacterium]